MNRVLLPLLLILTAAFAGAQNSDLGILLGVSVRSASVIGSGRVETRVGASFQINYAAQLHESVAGRLYLELPLLLAAESVSSVSSSGIRSADGVTVFFTPGVRFHHTIHPRIALYAALGGGVASFGGRVATVGRTGVSSGDGRSTSAALGFGGGLDFRVTRLLSLRAEGRDFVTKQGVGGQSGHNHFFFTVGVGFHF